VFKWLKNDWEILKAIADGSAKFDLSRIVSPQSFTLFVILAFCCGAFVSAKYFENQANEVIAERCQDNIIMEWNDCFAGCLMTENDNKPGTMHGYVPNLEVDNITFNI
jgi:hypothetical protein